MVTEIMDTRHRVATIELYTDFFLLPLVSFLVIPYPFAYDPALFLSIEHLLPCLSDSSSVSRLSCSIHTIHLVAICVQSTLLRTQNVTRFIEKDGG